jgi:hypothetical protein
VPGLLLAWWVILRWILCNCKHGPRNGFSVGFGWNVVRGVGGGRHAGGSRGAVMRGRGGVCFVAGLVGMFRILCNRKHGPRDRFFEGFGWNVVRRVGVGRHAGGSTGAVMPVGGLVVPALLLAWWVMFRILCNCKHGPRDRFSVGLAGMGRGVEVHEVAALLHMNPL